jgi:hypothetical protein
MGRRQPRSRYSRLDLNDHSNICLTFSQMQGKRGRKFGARLKDAKLENCPPPGAYSPTFIESKYPSPIAPSFGIKLQPPTQNDGASIGPGEYETKSTLKKTGKSFGLKTIVTEKLTYGSGPASYSPSLSSSQFASPLPKSFGKKLKNPSADVNEHVGPALYDTIRSRSPLSKVFTLQNLPIYY